MARSNSSPAAPAAASVATAGLPPVERSRLFVIPAAVCAVVLLASFLINDQLRGPAGRGQKEAEQMYVLAQALTDTLAVSQQLVRQRDAVGLLGVLRQLRALNVRIGGYAVPEMETLDAIELLREQAVERPDLFEQLQREGSIAARRLVLRGRDYQQVAAQREQNASRMLAAVLGCALLLSLAGLRWGAGVLQPPRGRAERGIASSAGVTDGLSELLLAHTQDSVCIADADGAIQRVNPAFCERTGYGAAEVIGQHLDFNLAPQPGQPRTVERGSTEGAGGGPGQGDVWQGEVWRRHKNGEAYVERASVVPLRDEEGNVRLLMAVAREHGVPRDAERLLRWQANHDALTKLPNRGLFLDHLAAALAGGTGACGVALIDLDRFKSVNDSLGYGAGDQVLVQVSHRLALAVRLQDRIARLDGDRFAVLLCAPLRAGEQTSVVKAIQERLSQPFTVEGREAFVTCSIGIAMAPGDGVQPDALVQAAERALELVKRRGGDDFRFFESAMNAQAARRVQIEQGLRRAVALGQMQVHYQPIVDVIDPSVYGVEALLRWTHPSLGSIPPSEFIPIAEVCGLMPSIGLWVLETVCTQIDLWLASGVDDLRVSVNVSGYQLRSEPAREDLRALLRGQYASRLCLEITESVLIENDAAVRRFLEDARAAGVRIAIDDFGTGFSSLGYLLHFPIDVVKIDKSFVDHMEQDNKALALVATIEAMGRILGMQVVAEGVESERQLDRLRIVGNRLVQGYVFARPMSGGDVTHYLQTGSERSGSERRGTEQLAG